MMQLQIHIYGVNEAALATEFIGQLAALREERANDRRQEVESLIVATPAKPPATALVEPVSPARRTRKAKTESAPAPAYSGSDASPTGASPTASSGVADGGAAPAADPVPTNLVEFRERVVKTAPSPTVLAQLKTYGVAKLSEVKADDYAKFLKDLEEMSRA